MMQSAIVNGFYLPDGFYFLQTGWWIFHIFAISTVFLVGFLVGSRRKAEAGRDAPGATGYNMVLIPATYRFLNTGWWILHLLVIPFTFILGHILWPA